MNRVRLFNNQEFGDFITLDKQGETYIESARVAYILGYKNPRKAIINHCDKNGIIFEAVNIPGGKRVEKKFINEANLYRLITKSKLPNAKSFEKWIYEEVLPSIRKTGMYMNTQTVDNVLDDPDLLLKLTQKLKEEKEKREIAQNQAIDLKNTINNNKGYMRLGKTISNIDDGISVGAFAKVLNNMNIPVGRNRLYQWLREKGYLISFGRDKNTPKQNYLEQGLFKTKEQTVETPEGEKLVVSTYITGKGQLYLINKILEERLQRANQEYIGGF